MKSTLTINGIFIIDAGDESRNWVINHSWDDSGPQSPIGTGANQRMISWLLWMIIQCFNIWWFDWDTPRLPAEYWSSDAGWSNLKRGFEVPPTFAPQMFLIPSRFLHFFSFFLSFCSSFSSFFPFPFPSPSHPPPLLLGDADDVFIAASGWFLPDDSVGRAFRLSHQQKRSLLNDQTIDHE